VRLPLASLSDAIDRIDPSERGNAKSFLT